jgi:hypothetical protein
LDRLAVVVALAAVACAGALALVPTGCIPDLPSNDGTGVGPDAAPTEAAPPPAPYCGDGIVDLAMGEQCDPGGATPIGCTPGCKIECDAGFHWPLNDHCYVDVPQGAASISEAIGTRCTGSTTHVVTFASAQELAAVVGALDASTFWVGMYQAVSKYDSVTTLEPGWDPLCGGCFVQEPDPTQPLPSTDAGGQACVEGFSDLDASWEEVPCTGIPHVRLHAICEREPQGRLSQPCTVGDASAECFSLRATVGTKTYVYIKTAAPPDYAEQQCESLGGTLVVLQSRDEREQLWKEVGGKIAGAATPFSIWIGLSTRDDAGLDWVWADDASADAYASPWADRQPRDDGGPAQAFMYNNGGTPPVVDDTLARVPAAAADYAYVCQLPVRDR